MMYCKSLHDVLVRCCKCRQLLVGHDLHSCSTGWRHRCKTMRSTMTSQTDKYKHTAKLRFHTLREWHILSLLSTFQKHLLCQPRHLSSVVDEHFFINESLSQMKWEPSTLYMYVCCNYCWRHSCFVDSWRHWSGFQAMCRYLCCLATCSTNSYIRP